MERLHRYFRDGFNQALSRRAGGGRRIGAELKFPLVDAAGRAASRQKVEALWAFLAGRGWEPVRDAVAGRVVGASKPGPRNRSVASSETGYCKTEFSLAHVGDLFELRAALAQLTDELREFSNAEDVYFLGYGIQPVTPPGKDLLARQGRTGVWQRFAGNRYIPQGQGDDMHLFTVNAASHVHVSVEPEEAVDAVNVLNGLAGAQIALMADSPVWKGRVDPDYLCPAEIFWDWWMADMPQRVGVPPRPYGSLGDYVDLVAGFPPVFVKRGESPITLGGYASFRDYFLSRLALGRDLAGREVAVEPEPADLDVHSTCYWHNARISRYYTVENRVHDQQPPSDLILPSALTLGLVSALAEANEEVRSHAWDDLKDSRVSACREALDGTAGGVSLKDLAGRMLAIARQGLAKRGKGEEVFLEPLFQRLADGRAPAHEARDLFQRGGVAALVAGRRL